ncbi:hypothetical protein [Pseudomonas lopnurensis]|uniref:hypothetical protein n=1 Tax=Pseudomonas lopnurensis TaxID=1477517 RepID=UPI0028AA044D|nr:hypothetical protein [Pseudomonas lopnurensis]
MTERFLDHENLKSKELSVKNRKVKSSDGKIMEGQSRHGHLAPTEEKELEMSDKSQNCDFFILCTRVSTTEGTCLHGLMRPVWMPFRKPGLTR